MAERPVFKIGVGFQSDVNDVFFHCLREGYLFAIVEFKGQVEVFILNFELVELDFYIRPASRDLIQRVLNVARLRVR